MTRKGTAWYVGTMLDQEGMDALVEALARESGVAPALATPAGVEAVRREAHGRSILFLLNYGSDAATIELDRDYRNLLTGEERSGALSLAPYDVAVLLAP